MNRILILGASELQIPMILEAKNKGYVVGVADMNKDAVGIKYADHFFNVSTLDINGLLKVVEDFKPLGVTTMATDMPMRTIARLNEKTNKRNGISYKTAVNATDKYKMYLEFEKNGISVPNTYVVENKMISEKTRDKLKFPCIVKPTDSSGSRGVTKVYSIIDLNDAIMHANENSRNGKVIIQEFLTGREVSVEAFAINGKVEILAITDKITTGDPHFVELSHHQPADFSPEITSKIKSLSKKAVTSLGVENGPAHVEIMVTEKGPYLIELGARLGGDFITSHLVPFSTGINMIALTIDLAMNKKVELTNKKNNHSYVEFLHIESGKIKSINFVERAKSIKYVEDIVLFKNNGDIINGIKSSSDRIGAIICKAPTYNDCLLAVEEAKNVIEIHLEDKND